MSVTYLMLFKMQNNQFSISFSVLSSFVLVLFIFQTQKKTTDSVSQVSHFKEPSVWGLTSTYCGVCFHQEMAIIKLQ